MDGQQLHIQRIQIEGGFLNGVNIAFQPGLNVVIGARGTGKTSLIELIRFASGAKSHTALSGKRSLDHATAILDGGEVGLELSNGYDSVLVNRSSTDGRPRSNHRFSRPMVYSQTEIETIGLSAPGRLELIDGFILNIGDLQEKESRIKSAIHSAFAEIKSAQDELSDLLQGSQDIEAFTAEANTLKLKQDSMLPGSTEISQKREQLAAVIRHLSEESVRETTLLRFRELSESWQRRLSQPVASDFGIDVWNSQLGPDPLASFRPEYAKQISRITEVANAFSTLAEASAAQSQAASKRRVVLELKSKSLRAEIEQHLTGASSLSRRLSQLEESIAQHKSRSILADNRLERLNMLRKKRDDLLSQLYLVRDERFHRRQAVAKNLSSALRPFVKVGIEHFGQYSEYSRVLADTMRGSGMRYADISASVSERIPPGELLKIVENDDYIKLAEITNIPRDRADRIISYLGNSDMSEIVTVEIEDNVTMMLLDGVDFKPIEHLSAGQRCTVILSIVMQHKERILVLDQPEDHLDNAYIASTVIKSLLDRGANSQIILATHNANIPVLGNADLVIQLTSDGQTGTVEVCKPLFDYEAVQAISNVMEGGRLAFEARSSFYEEHYDL